MRSTLRLRQLELMGAVGADGLRAAVWTRGRLDRGSIALAGRLRPGGQERRVRLRLTATGLDLARTLRLAGQAVVRDVRGRVDLRARYDEAGPTDRLVRRASGALRGHDVALGAR